LTPLCAGNKDHRCNRGSRRSGQDCHAISNAATWDVGPHRGYVRNRSFARVDKKMISLPHPETVAAPLAGKARDASSMATPLNVFAVRSRDTVHAGITMPGILGAEHAIGVVFAVGRALLANNPNDWPAVKAAFRAIIASKRDPSCHPEHHPIADN
jgi:hypothetical protein